MRDPGRFFSIPVPVIESTAYKALDGSARALLLDVSSQYVGTNNGRLLAGWTFMSEERGWRGKHTLIEAKRKLLASGQLIVETRMGKFPNTAAWYACTWWPLDWCSDMEMPLASFPRAAYRSGAQPLSTRVTRDHDKARKNPSGSITNASLSANSAQESTRIGADSALRASSVGAVSAPMRPQKVALSSAESAHHLDMPSTAAHAASSAVPAVPEFKAVFSGRPLANGSELTTADLLAIARRR